jgi:hypothetical protein
MRITIAPAEYRYRDHQWTAFEGDYDLGVPVGSGPTAEAALEDLLWHLDLEALPPNAVIAVEDAA